MRQVVRYTGIVILFLCGMCGYGQRLSVGDLYEDGEDRGIIFWVSRDKTEAWIVAMEDSGGPYEGQELWWWISNGFIEVRSEDIREAVSGYRNTRILRNYYGTGNEHPVQIVDFERGWYLPAIGQLIRLAEQADAVNAALRAFGGEELSEDYFSSSTEWNTYGLPWTIWIPMYEVTSRPFTNEIYVRAVKTVQLVRRDYTCLWSPGNETSLSVTVEPERGRNDYAVTLTSLEGGCTTTLTRSVMVATADTVVFRDTVCRGQTYSEHGFHTAVAGRHELTVPVEGGCSLHTRLELQVADTFYREFYDHFCVGSRYTAHGLWTDRPGRYVQRWQSQQGCDSTVVVNLTGDPVYRAFFTADVCRGASYAGYGFNVDRVDRDTLLTSRSTATLTGCDSVTELLLTVRPAYEQELADTVCRGSSYVRGEEVLVAAAERDTVIRYREASATGACDTNVTLRLAVVANPERWETAALCEGEHYRKYGVDKTASEDFDVTVAGDGVCDTLVHVSLRVYSPPEVVLNDTVCRGGSYVRGDTVLLAAAERDTVIRYQAAAATGACDTNVTLRLAVVADPERWETAALCEGEHYRKYGLDKTVSEDFEVTVAGSRGCDTTVHVSLRVYSPPEVVLSDTVCRGSSYVRGDTVLLAVAERDTVIHYQVASATGVCDTNVTLQLTVRPRPERWETAALCEGEHYRKYGLDKTVSEDFDVTLAGDGVCDTLVHVSLRVYSPPELVLSDTVCRGSSYVRGDAVQVAVAERDTVIRYQVASATGVCDTNVTLRLTVVPNPERWETAALCEGEHYRKYGLDKTVSEDFDVTLAGDGVCDTLVHVSLRVYSPPAVVLNDFVCPGGSYGRGDTVLLAAAERDTVIRYQAAGEVCDTSVTLWLTVVPKPERWETAALCEGEHYRKYGLDKTVSEDFDVTLAGSRGCDTTVHVSLRVYPRTEVRLSDSVCYGDRYSRYPWWRSPVVTRDTQLQVHLSSTWGCDSLVVVSLRCLPLPRKWVADTIVTGEVYTAYGLSATESGIYPVRLAGVGCDTLLEVALTVKKPYEQWIEATVCKGQRYSEWGFDVTEPGEYRRKVKGPGHNDTVYYLSLRQLPSYNFLVERGICRGEGVAFGGMVYTEEGVYPRYFLTSAGCDSTVTLSLQVNEYAEGEVVADLVDCRRHEYHFGVELSSGSGELDYVWELGDGTGAEAKEVVHQYADTGWQEVKVKITTSAGCSREARQRVYVPYYPQKLTVEADPAGVDENNLFLTFRTAALPGMRYDWDFGDGTTAFGAGAEVRHLYSLTDEKGFEVKVRLTNSDDCVAEAGLNIRAYPSFVVPNTFSPNDDGTNDVFMPGYRVRIVNRLGWQVYEGADGWDGTDGGQKAQEDTYFYELWYETLYGQKTQTGYITLVR